MGKMGLDFSDLYLWIKLHQGAYTIQVGKRVINRTTYQTIAKKIKHRCEWKRAYYIIKKIVILCKVKTIKYFMWFGEI